MSAKIGATFRTGMTSCTVGRRRRAPHWQDFTGFGIVPMTLFADIVEGYAINRREDIYHAVDMAGMGAGIAAGAVTVSAGQLRTIRI